MGWCWISALCSQWDTSTWLIEVGTERSHFAKNLQDIQRKLFDNKRLRIDRGLYDEVDAMRPGEMTTSGDEDRLW